MKIKNWKQENINKNSMRWKRVAFSLRGELLHKEPELRWSLSML